MLLIFEDSHKTREGGETLKHYKNVLINLLMFFLNCFPLKYSIYHAPHSVLQMSSLLLKTL